MVSFYSGVKYIAQFLDVKLKAVSITIFYKYHLVLMKVLKTELSLFIFLLDMLYR